MIIDISYDHANSVVDAFFEERAEYYGYLEELWLLDLRVEAQALHVIRTWLLPDTLAWTPTGRFQRREACRFIMMRGSHFGDYWLPGQYRGPPVEVDPVEYEAMAQRFQQLIWRELFPETPYEPLPHVHYRQRVDQRFEMNPDLPDSWGPPEYRPWPTPRVG